MPRLTCTPDLTNWSKPDRKTYIRNDGLAKIDRYNNGWIPFVRLSIDHDWTEFGGSSKTLTVAQLNCAHELKKMQDIQARSVSAPTGLSFMVQFRNGYTTGNRWSDFQHYSSMDDARAVAGSLVDGGNQARIITIYVRDTGEEEIISQDEIVEQLCSSDGTVISEKINGRWVDV